ncbi:hypothetical protein AY599_02015 [Leptolyngbya valderiana BDU 20041]|nr:hypothetical protein AY599_02015 [Leptolyngbya valderiana BDU 20041]
MTASARDMSGFDPSWVAGMPEDMRMRTKKAGAPKSAGRWDTRPVLPQEPFPRDYRAVRTPSGPSSAQ